MRSSGTLDLVAVTVTADRPSEELRCKVLGYGGSDHLGGSAVDERIWNAISGRFRPGRTFYEK
jgi:molecular chaperone DnaK (HSP70)